MKLEKALYQKSYLYFIVFFLMALAAFWFTYFMRIDKANMYMHAHGITLILWCLMLIIQPFLIRGKKYALHALIGKFSYILVPLLIISTLSLLKFNLTGRNLGTMGYYFMALVINGLLAFLIIYLLAIIYRKQATVHARFMFSTAFAMITPVTDRLIYIYFPSFVPYLPTIEGNPIAPVAGFLLADLIIIGLCIWDWTSHKRWNVFPIVLVVLLAYHYSVLNFYQFDFWKVFSNWFVQL